MSRRVCFCFELLSHLYLLLIFFCFQGHGHRRNKSVGGAFEAIREGAIFEAFLLVGQTTDEGFL